MMTETLQHQKPAVFTESLSDLKEKLDECWRDYLTDPTLEKWRDCCKLSVVCEYFENKLPVPDPA